MTRAQMEAVIRGGGTILHEGRMIAKVEDLPTGGDLAGSDLVKLRAEQTKLRAAAAANKAEQDKVDALIAQAEKEARKTPETPAPAKKAG